MRNFQADLLLARRILNPDFKDEDLSHSDLSAWADHLENALSEDEDLHDELGSTGLRLREIEAGQRSIVAQFGDDTYQLMHRMELQTWQRAYLRSSERAIHSPLKSMVLHGRRSDDADLFLDGVMRNLMSNPISTLELGGSPVHEGASAVFDQQVRKALGALVTPGSRLAPLLTMLSITVIIVQPKAPGNRIDLDNLARTYILPRVHEILRPPVGFSVTGGAESLPSEVAAWWVQELEREKRRPEHSVVRYEVIELPRRREDPPNGYVRIGLGDGFMSSSLWSRVCSALSKWSDAVEWW